jgi:hypothetical protein
LITGNFTVHQGKNKVRVTVFKKKIEKVQGITQIFLAKDKGRLKVPSGRKEASYKNT